MIRESQPSTENASSSSSKAAIRRGRGPALRLGVGIVLLLGGLMVCVLALQGFAASSNGATRASGDNWVFMPILMSRLNPQLQPTPTATPTASMTPTASPTPTITLTPGPSPTPDGRVYRFGVNFIPDYGRPDRLSSTEPAFWLV